MRVGEAAEVAVGATLRLVLVVRDEHGNTKQLGGDPFSVEILRPGFTERALRSDVVTYGG